MLPRWQDEVDGGVGGGGVRRRRDTSPKKRRGKKGFGFISCCIYCLAFVWVTAAGYFIASQIMRGNAIKVYGMVGVVILGPESKLANMWQNKVNEFAKFLEKLDKVEGYDGIQVQTGFNEGDVYNELKRKSDQIKADVESIRQQHLSKVGIVASQNNSPPQEPTAPKQDHSKTEHHSQEASEHGKKAGPEQGKSEQQDSNDQHQRSEVEEHRRHGEMEQHKQDHGEASKGHEAEPHEQREARESLGVQHAQQQAQLDVPREAKQPGSGSESEAAKHHNHEQAEQAAHEVINATHSVQHVNSHEDGSNSKSSDLAKPKLPSSDEESSSSGVKHEQKGNDVVATSGENKEERVISLSDLQAARANFDKSKVALLVIATFNHDTNDLLQTLSTLLELPEINNHDIYIAQDSSHGKLNSIIHKYVAKGLAQSIMFSDEHEHNPRKRHSNLLVHSVKHVLDLPKQYSHIMTIGNSMRFAPDVLDFFYTSAPLLEVDKSLWCVSAFNENGLSHFHWDEWRLLRDSFFSGVMSMMSRGVWTEVMEQWEQAGSMEVLEEWMNTQEIRRDRDCAIPEVSRAKRLHSSPEVHDPFSGIYESIALASSQPNSQLWGDVRYLTRSEYDKHILALIQTGKLLPEQENFLPLASHARVPFIKVVNEHNQHAILKSLKLSGTGTGQYRGLTVLKRERESPVVLVRHDSPFMSEVKKKQTPS